MKVYRYMSAQELKNFNSGMEMVPAHMHHKAATTSTGFCFLPEVVCLYRHKDSGSPVKDTMSPEGSLSFLSGIVSEEFLIEFEAPDHLLRKSRATYQDPYGSGLMEIDELCCNSYSKENFIPLRYGIIDFYGIQWRNLNKGVGK